MGTAPPPPPAPSATGSEAPAAWDGFGNPVARPSYDDRPAYGAQAPVGSTPPPYAGGPAGGPPYAGGGPPYAGGPGGYPGSGPGGAPGTGGKPSFLARNGYSFGTVGVAIVYLLLLVYVHIAIIGILPFFLGVGAVRRKEPLGWPALVIGIVAIVIGIYEFSR